MQTRSHAGWAWRIIRVLGSLSVGLSLLGRSGARAADWPEWMGAGRDGVWRETGIVERFPSGSLPQVWRVPLGAGYSGPSVARGSVFVMDRLVPTNAPRAKGPFDTSQIPGQERVVCLSAKDGREKWVYAYDCPYTVSYAAGPRVTPLVRDGRVYALGTMGNLACLDAATGRPIWTRDFKADYGLKVPTWGVSAHPLLVGHQLFCLVGGEGSVAVAFDARTGRELWRSLSAREPGYCPPVLHEFGGRRQLVVWHAEAVNGLDPATGQVLWTEPWKLNYGMSIALPRKVDNDLFLTCFYNGSQLLRFDPGQVKPRVVWRTAKMSERDTTHLNSTMSTPVIEGGHVYGACSYGQFRCLRLETGDRKSVV